MKFRVLLIVIITMILTLSISGCSEEDAVATEVKVTTLGELCNGKLSDVDRILVRDGTTGKYKTLEDKEKIRVIITILEASQVSIHPNEPSQMGWTTGYTFYHGKDHILAITRRGDNRFKLFGHDSFKKGNRGVYEEIIEEGEKSNIGRAIGLINGYLKCNEWR